MAKENSIISVDVSDKAAASILNPLLSSDNAVVAILLICVITVGYLVWQFKYFFDAHVKSMEKQNEKWAETLKEVHAEQRQLQERSNDLQDNTNRVVSDLRVVIATLVARKD